MTTNLVMLTHQVWGVILHVSQCELTAWHNCNVTKCAAQNFYAKYVEIKCQLDATEIFIADLTAYSTCFGHHYAHHQKFKSTSILQTGCITLSSTPDQLLEEPQHEIPHAATTV